MTTQPDLKSIRALVIDMDGVLWRGETPLPGLHDFFAVMQKRHIDFMLATNNATKTQAQYVQKFAKFGLEISPEQVMTSSLATAEYLKTQFASGTRLHVIGQDGIRQAITAAGFELADHDVAAVVVGLDFELTYEKLRTATLLINQGARFIGSNGDLTFPFEGGIAPGNGAILAALEAATGQKPITVGKPEPIIFQVALKQLGTALDETAMLGDRLGTDILGGHRAGLKTILVLTGISQQADIAASSVKPDWVFSGIDTLATQLV